MIIKTQAILLALALGGTTVLVTVQAFAASTVAIARTNNGVAVRWQGPGVLQSASTAAGSWTDMPQAVASLTVPATNPLTFFRTRGPTFTVVDTGVGMNPEQAARVFLAYEQAEQTISKRYGGTGLGLALAKSFVELMEGSISLTTEEGRGTTVTVQLPWAPSELEQTR